MERNDFGPSFPHRKKGKEFLPRNSAMMIKRFTPFQVFTRVPAIQQILNLETRYIQLIPDPFERKKGGGGLQ